MDEWLEFSEILDRIEDLIDMGLLEDAVHMIDEHAPAAEGRWEIPFLRSRIFMEQNKPHGAIPHLRHSLRLDPRNGDCLLGLFYAYSQIDRPAVAAKYLLRAARFHPDNDQVLAGLIWHYTERGKFDDALQAYERARLLSSDNPDVYRNAGIAHQKIGDYENAEACFRAALDLSPHFDEVRDILADQYIFAGDHEKGILLYQEYLKTSPRNIRAMSRLVFCLSQADRVAEAEAVAAQIIAAYPKSTIGYVDLSYVHLNAGDHTRAVEYADKAINISPADAEAYRARAIALSEAEKDADATATFEKAMELDRNNPEIMRDYYNHLRETGEFEKMEQLVFQVIRIEQPYCVEDYWFLADFYRDEGKDTKALQYLRKAHRSMPGEHNLIPPIASILLDHNHTKYAIPLMFSYVKRVGWDENMNVFAHHRRLQGRFGQEGMRMMRSFGEHPADFRHYLFSRSVRAYLPFAMGALLPVLLPLFWMLWSWVGIGIVAAFYTAFFGVFYGAAKIPRFRISFARNQQNAPPLNAPSAPTAPPPPLAPAPEKKP